QRSVQELTIVADSFHTKPLRRLLQSADRYQLLGLSRHEIKLFEGNRDALGPVELTSDVTQKITDARGNDLTEPNQSVASYGSSGGVGKPTHHGLGGNETVVDIDADRFF